MMASTSLARPREGQQGRRRRRKQTCLCLLLSSFSFAGAAEAGSVLQPRGAFKVGPRVRAIEEVRSTSPARTALRLDASVVLSSVISMASSSVSSVAVETTSVPSSGLVGVTSSPALSSSGVPPSSVVSSTATSSAVAAQNTTVPAGYTLPEAFDSTLSTTFTSTACPSFFQTFLADPVFKSCAPFSLLLTTSTGFFNAERSPYSLLPFVLDASCSASNETCSSLMSSLATKIKLSNTCGPDLQAGNSLAVEALQGFENYDMMRKAGCQRNAQTQQYCFAEAAAQPNASEIYFYYLASGTSLPSGTTTQCEGCTQGLLDIYSTYAKNATLAISKTYSAARQVAALTCGPTFAPLVAATTVPTSSSPSLYPSTLVVTLPLLLAAVIR